MLWSLCHRGCCSLRRDSALHSVGVRVRRGAGRAVLSAHSQRNDLLNATRSLARWRLAVLAAQSFGLTVAGAARHNAGPVPAMPKAEPSFVCVCGAVSHLADAFPTVLSAKMSG